MLRHYYIKKEWIVSARARLIFRAAGILSLTLFLIVMWGPTTDQLPALLIPAMRLLVLAGVLGAAITLVAMEYFLFRFDSSPAFKKAFWFCVMLLPLVGASVYCLIVYSRSEVLRTACAKRAEGASA